MMMAYPKTFVCFCQFQKQNQGALFGQMLGDPNPVCDEYLSKLLWRKINCICIAMVIVAVNLVLKETILSMVYWIGEATVTEQESLVMIAVFLAQFTNTAILILLVNANLQEYSNSRFIKYFDG